MDDYGHCTPHTLLITSRAHCTFHTGNFPYSQQHTTVYYTLQLHAVLIVISAHCTQSLSSSGHTAQRLYHHQCTLQSAHSGACRVCGAVRSAGWQPTNHQRLGAGECIYPQMQLTNTFGIVTLFKEFVLEWPDVFFALLCLLATCDKSSKEFVSSGLFSISFWQRPLITLIRLFLTVLIRVYWQSKWKFPLKSRHYG